MSGLPFPTRRVRDRFACLEPLLARRHVVDLGVVDARPERGAAGDRTARADLLFRRIHAQNADVLGIDRDAAGIAALASEGFRVLCADVEDLALEERFDLLVAGELIEHLSNPGRFLSGLRRIAAPGAALFLSTPNPFAARQLGKVVRRGRPAVHEDHVAWYDPLVLGRLCRASGWTPVECAWVEPRGLLRGGWASLLRGYFAPSFVLLSRLDDPGAQ